MINDPTEERRAILTAVINEILKVSPADLVRTADLGRELDFSAALYYFKKSRDLFEQLSTTPLAGLPPASLDGCLNIANQYNSLIKAIGEYKAAQGPGVRDNLVNQVTGQFQNIFNVVAPVVAYGSSTRTLTEEQDRLAHLILEATAEINQKVSEIEKVKTTAEASLAEASISAQRSLESIQDAAAKSGVSTNARFFKEEYAAHQKAAKKWLLAVIAAGILTAICAFLSSYLYIKEIRPTDVAGAVQFAVAKLAALSVLYFFLIWCSRNYLATRHNATVNQHRAIALSTFETFVNASSDEQTKNAVLLKATQAIFAPEVTGYLAKEPPASVSPQLVEIFRGFSEHAH
jgi:hypothetical protein